MPLINTSTYKAPFLFRNAHTNTVYAALARKVSDIFYERQVLDTPDGDFLDLDWSTVKSNKLVIALHGLEGSADRPYMRGMIREFNRNGWDGLGFNFRGCGGKLNRKAASYHMGWTADLEFVIEYILNLDRYREVVLVGFSLGGNVILNYLGRTANSVPKLVKKAVTFSVPCHIESANVEIHKLKNWPYLRRFIVSLNEKVREKAKTFPEELTFDSKNAPKDFYEFDEQYTAPLNGFESNLDYWRKNSCIDVLPEIQIPTILINSTDDTFLSPQCFPVELAKNHSFFHFEAPKYGGHVGFVSFNKDGSIWSEKRAIEFVNF